jgi:DNA-binding response OmpR family regulator
MKTNHLLLIEDSQEIYTLVSQALGNICHIDWVKSVQDARTALKNETYQLILLDVGLPDGSGFDFCTELHSQNKLLETPVFFLTAKAELSEKVLGFSAGADDYIVKPFAPLELRARVEGRLRKMEMLKDQSGHYKWKELEIDTQRQKVWVFNEDRTKDPVDLTALEFKLLALFAKQPEAVISRDDILNEIWGEDVHVYSRSVDTHVSKLRKKLGPQSDLIESVHGTGYKFCPTPA